MRPKPAELAAELIRYNRRVWQVVGFVLGFGTLTYLMSVFATILVRGVQGRRLPFLERIDLGLAPNDGIVIAAALLAVVVSLNVALAAQTVPDDPWERVRMASWQQAIAFIALLSASSSVAICLVFWISERRSAGAGLGLGLITALATGLGSTVSTRALTAEALTADELRVTSRLQRLDGTIEQLVATRPFPGWGLLRTWSAQFLLAILIGSSSILVELAILGLEHRRIRVGDLLFLAGAGALFVLAMQISASRIRLLRHLPEIADRISNGGILLISSFPTVAFASLILIEVPQIRAADTGYLIWLTAVPLIAFRLDRTVRLAAGPRATIGRLLTAKRAMLHAELAEVASKAASRRMAERRGNWIRQSGTAAPRPPRRRRRPRPAGHRSPPA